MADTPVFLNSALLGKLRPFLAQLLAQGDTPPDTAKLDALQGVAESLLDDESLNFLQRTFLDVVDALAEIHKEYAKAKLQLDTVLKDETAALENLAANPDDVAAHFGPLRREAESQAAVLAEGRKEMRMIFDAMRQALERPESSDEVVADRLDTLFSDHLRKLQSHLEEMAEHLNSRNELAKALADPATWDKNSPSSPGGDGDDYMLY